MVSWLCGHVDENGGYVVWQKLNYYGTAEMKYIQIESCNSILELI